MSGQSTNGYESSIVRAFADDAALNQISAELSAYNYRNHVHRLSNGAH
jgi:hypothetical protein